MIGTGLAELRGRASPALWVGLLVLLLAFLADTATTVAARADDVRPVELNPLIRDLSPAAYLVGAAIRFAAAVALLVWFWPAQLDAPARSAIRPLVLPLWYRRRRTYFGAALVLVGPPLKLLAAASNWWLLNRGEAPWPPAQTLVCGLAVGVVFSNALLAWHGRTLASKRTESTPKLRSKK